MKVTLLHCPGQSGEYQLVYGLEDWPISQVRRFRLEKATVVYVRPALPGEDNHPGRATHSAITSITNWAAVQTLEHAHGVNADHLKDGVEADSPSGQMFLFDGATFSGLKDLASVG